MTTQSPTTPIKVYMIGNNPIDISDVYQKLKDYASDSFHTEYGFDLKKAFRHILKSRPSCVLIDDNIGLPIMQKFMAKLSAHKDTQDIPVAVLKNSNYRESGAVLASATVPSVTAPSPTVESGVPESAEASSPLQPAAVSEAPMTTMA